MPSEETIKEEERIAAMFTRDDARQKKMGVRLDRVKRRDSKGRQGTQAQQADHKMDMKVRERYMTK